MDKTLSFCIKQQRDKTTQGVKVENFGINFSI